MKNSLRRILAAALLLALALSLTPGLSEGFESTEPKTFTDAPKADKFEEAGTLKIGVFYHADDNQGYKLEWVFYPQETGICMVYGRSLKDEMAWRLRITNKFGEEIKNIYIQNHDMKPYIIPLEVTAGKEYHLRFESQWQKYKYAIAVCGPSSHVGPTTAMTVIEEPTCTQPGTKAQCCALCGGQVKTMPIPAAGHKAGPETVFVEPTCYSTGLKGTQCEVCGERIMEITIPMTAHTPDVWMDYRRATCTEDGIRVQQCKYCGETLKTETVPALGHSFSAWSADGNGQQSRYCVNCGYTEYQNGK